MKKLTARPSLVRLSEVHKEDFFELKTRAEIPPILCRSIGEALEAYFSAHPGEWTAFLQQLDQ